MLGILSCKRVCTTPAPEDTIDSGVSPGHVRRMLYAARGLKIIVTHGIQSTRFWLSKVWLRFLWATNRVQNVPLLCCCVVLCGQPIVVDYTSSRVQEIIDIAKYPHASVETKSQRSNEMDRARRPRG
jgi:hypothetical protein